MRVRVTGRGRGERERERGKERYGGRGRESGVLEREGEGGSERSGRVGEGGEGGSERTGRIGAGGGWRQGKRWRAREKEGERNKGEREGEIEEREGEIEGDNKHVWCCYGPYGTFTCRQTIPPRKIEPIISD